MSQSTSVVESIGAASVELTVQAVKPVPEGRLVLLDDYLKAAYAMPIAAQLAALSEDDSLEPGETAVTAGFVYDEDVTVTVRGTVGVQVPDELVQALHCVIGHSTEGVHHLPQFVQLLRDEETTDEQIAALVGQLVFAEMLKSLSKFAPSPTGGADDLVSAGSGSNEGYGAYL